MSSSGPLEWARGFQYEESETPQALTDQVARLGRRPAAGGWRSQIAVCLAAVVGEPKLRLPAAQRTRNSNSRARPPEPWRAGQRNIWRRRCAGEASAAAAARNSSTFLHHNKRPRQR